MINKSKFLARLQDRIDMLDDVEQKDILDEYAQHIDMKVESGMTEAEAIADFGPIDDLVAEILSAYHVKVPEAKTSSRAGFGDLKDGGMNAASKAADATKRGLSRMGDAASSLFGKAKSGIAKRPGAAAAGVDAASAGGGAASADGGVGIASDSPASGGADLAAGAAGVARASAGGIGKLFRSLKNGSISLGTFCIKVLLTCVRWCWNILVACCGLCAIGFALCSVFAFGTSLVTTIQGYPTLGIAIFLLGSLLFFGSVSVLISKLIVRKAQAAAAVKGILHDDADGSPDGTPPAGPGVSPIAPMVPSASPTAPMTPSVSPAPQRAGRVNASNVSIAGVPGASASAASTAPLASAGASATAPLASAGVSATQPLANTGVSATQPLASATNPSSTAPIPLVSQEGASHA